MIEEQRLVPALHIVDDRISHASEDLVPAEAHIEHLIRREPVEKRENAYLSDAQLYPGPSTANAEGLAGRLDDQCMQLAVK